MEQILPGWKKRGDFTKELLIPVNEATDSSLQLNNNGNAAQKGINNYETLAAMFVSCHLPVLHSTQ